MAQFSRLAEEVAILGILAASGSVVSGAVPLALGFTVWR